MTTRIRNPGEFCWINMLTPQPTEACAFFEKLLGWSYAEIPGMGYLIKVGGSDIGGLFDLNSPQTPKGTPPLIGVMVEVENVDATAEKIKSSAVRRSRRLILRTTAAWPSATIPTAPSSTFGRGTRVRAPT